MRITLNSKCRLCRTEGCKLMLKGARCLSAKCPIEKRGAVRPGMHGAKSPSKPTDYGIQLRAKQKAKRLYGIQEAQFRKIYANAQKMKGLVGDNFLVLLERRLDNAVYLSGLSLSRSLAKQFISHKHILVNGKPLNVSSYETKVGDVITLSKTALEQYQEQLPAVQKDFNSPSWIDLNKQTYTAKITSLPIREEITNGVDVNLIIEFYSR